MTLRVQVKNLGAFGSTGYQTVYCDRVETEGDSVRLHVTRILGNNSVMTDMTVYRKASDVVGVRVL